jgi:hypothetical protein
MYHNEILNKKTQLIICECGIEIQKCSKLKHEKRKKHIAWKNQQTSN